MFIVISTFIGISWTRVVYNKCKHNCAYNLSSQQPWNSTDNKDNNTTGSGTHSYTASSSLGEFSHLAFIQLNNTLYWFVLLATHQWTGIIQNGSWASISALGALGTGQSNPGPFDLDFDNLSTVSGAFPIKYICIDYRLAATDWKLKFRSTPL